MSSGDKTLSENYLQHADHFMRIIEDKNKNRKSYSEKVFLIKSHRTENKSLSDNSTY